MSGASSQSSQSADPPTTARQGKSGSAGAGGRGAAAPAPPTQPAQPAQPRRESSRQAAAGTRGAEDRARSPLTDPALSRPGNERSSGSTGRGTSGRGGSSTQAAEPPTRAAAPEPQSPTRRNGAAAEAAVGAAAGRTATPEAPTRATPPREEPQPRPRSIPQPPEEAFTPGPSFTKTAEPPPYSEEAYARAQEALGRGPAYNIGREQYSADYAAQAAGQAAGGQAVDPGGATRRAHLRISRISPKSVSKISFMFSLCVFVIILVAVAVLWFVLDSIGVFHSIEDAANTLNGKPNGGIDDWLGFQRVIGIAFIIGVVDIVLMTALSTLGALLYNLCTDLVGGVEVTLTER